jgi:hypothetical protein
MDCQNETDFYVTDMRLAISTHGSIPLKDLVIVGTNLTQFETTLILLVEGTTKPVTFSDNVFMGNVGSNCLH